MTFQIKEFPLASLRFNPLQPPGRDRRSVLRRLAESIKVYGLACPPSIDPSGLVLDGHTRINAVKLLGWKRIPCCVRERPAPPELLASLQGNVQKQSPRMKIQTWSLAEQHGIGEAVLAALDPSTRRRITWLVNCVYGERIHAQIALHARLTPSLAESAREIVAFTECAPLKVCEWLLEHNPSMRMLRNRFHPGSKTAVARLVKLARAKILANEALSEAEWGRAAEGDRS